MLKTLMTRNAFNKQRFDVVQIDTLNEENSEMLLRDASYQEAADLVDWWNTQTAPQKEEA
jgi:hypothetical protein